MKNRAKKNNKGFSLVELIVVVLIIGVIAISLAPQVMKWVDNSKINADINNASNLKASVQAALADWQKDGGHFPSDADKKVILIYDGSGSLKKSDLTGDDSDSEWTDAMISKVIACIDDVTTKDLPESKYDNNNFKIIITSDGKVTVTCGAQSATIS